MLKVRLTLESTLVSILSFVRLLCITVLTVLLENCLAMKALTDFATGVLQTCTIRSNVNKTIKVAVTIIYKD